jgi:hypothetical protein
MTLTCSCGNTWRSQKGRDRCEDKHEVKADA